jgi:hypothetical protein
MTLRWLVAHMARQDAALAILPTDDEEDAKGYLMWRDCQDCRALAEPGEDYCYRHLAARDPLSGSLHD